jgi:hypothetical protein
LLDTRSANMLRNGYEKHGKTPAYAKVEMYHYQMAASLWELLPQHFTRDKIQWWNRTYEESLVPVVALRQGTGKLYGVVDSTGYFA